MAKRSTFNEKDIKNFETALGLQPLEISDLHAIFGKAGIKKANNTFFTQRQKDYLFKQIYHDYMLRDELRNYVIEYKKKNKQPIGNIFEDKNKKAMKLTENKLNQIIKSSIKKVLNEGQSDGNLIEKWNYWCVNYNHDFIEKAWSDNPIMVAHLKSKFDHYYDMEGSYGVMNKFYLNLDEENRRILENYVINNY